jgi:photosystem II stability/assembly factor-like uncharacterized protein
VVSACLVVALVTAGLIGWGILGAWQGLSENPSNTVTAAAATSVSVTSLHCSGGSTPYSSCNDTSGNVMLSWTQVSGATAITVKRATSPNGTYSTIATLAGTATTYTDTTAAYNTQYYYEVFSGTPNWIPAANVDMALSLPPTGGIDDTVGTGGATFTAANLTAMATAGGTTYTTTTAWGAATNSQLGGQEPDWMSCVSASQCWTFTNQGDIWVSTNGAQTWTEETVPITPVWYGGEFVNASDGWAVGAGGDILVTTNGGTTWTQQTSGSTEGLYAISCVSTTHCWVSGQGGVILVTTNGGTTWTAQTSGTTQELTEVWCVSATNCWVSGAAGVILATTNGGTTWTAQTSGTTQELYGISCVSTTQCWAAGGNGVILATTNGGTTWTAQTSGTTNAFYAIQCVAPTDCWADGANGSIYATTNGTTWTAQTSGNTDNFWQVECISTTQCWAVGANIVMVTTNGGATWYAPSTQYVQWTFTPTVSTGPVSSAVLTLVDDASATPSAATKTYVLVSANSGASWTPFTIANPTTALATQTLSISSVINSATAVSGMEVRYQVLGSNAYTSTFDLVHVDIN